MDHKRWIPHPRQVPSTPCIAELLGHATAVWKTGAAEVGDLFQLI